MKYFLYLTISLLLAVSNSSAEYYPVRFQEGYTYSIEQLHMYSDPSLSSEYVAHIPPGELIEIKEFSGVTVEADSCNWGWYLAEYRLENIVYEGLVLDKHLAFTSVSLGIDSILAFSLSSFNTDLNKFEGNISLVVDGEIAHSISYVPNWTPYARIFDYDVSLAFHNSSGLSGVKYLATFYSGLDVSDLHSREDIIIITEQGEIIPGPQAVSFYHENESRYSSRIILPSFPEGTPNMITIHSSEELFDSTAGSWLLSDEVYSEYLWHDNSFIKEETTN